MYKKIELDNGLRIILNNMPHMESAAIGVWISTGSIYEKRELSGISHFLEHMIFKGTPLLTSRRIKEEIEGRGGSLNGFTSEEMTCYLAKVSGAHIDIALGVLSEMALNASLAYKDIEKERTVIIEEIKMYRDLPNHHVHDLLSELMWPNHPLGLSIAGDIKSVSSITRQDLLSYKKASYAVENMVLVLCGNLDQDAVVKKIKKIFRLNTKANLPSVNGFKNFQSKPLIKTLHKDTHQTHLLLGMHTFGREHKDRYVLGLLHIILGGNMSSRLFEKVREKKGLAYEIGTEIKRYKDTGGFVVKAGIEHKNVKKVVEIILKELKRIKNTAVSAEELKRAKEFFKVQFLLGLEDTLDHMLWLGEHVVTSGKLPDKKDIIKKANAVSIDDLQRVAEDIFKRKGLNLALIGPIRDTETKEIEKELQLL